MSAQSNKKYRSLAIYSVHLKWKVGMSDIFLKELFKFDIIWPCYGD